MHRYKVHGIIPLLIVVANILEGLKKHSHGLLSYFGFVQINH